MKVFLDANILISASLPKSRLRLLVRKAGEHAALLTNQYAVEEARRNVCLKKPEALPLLDSLCAQCTLVAATVNISVELAEKDIPILGGAIAGGATYLLTGDRKDFGVLWGKTLQGVKIVSPQMLAEEMVKKRWLRKKKQ